MPELLSSCAIYTRQSRASDREFSSCDAQFEVCSQFIRSQIGAGWRYEELRYDDDGRSGENLDRPGLIRLLADAEAGLFDRLVVQRLDRLSRKVVDSALLFARLRQLGVSVVIVTMPELGATANDRLMLNLLSSFAEFEREIIRDRLADARASLKRRGRRVAGVVPYGYSADPVTKQLQPERSEARRVKAMFERAARGETPRQIADHANRRGWRTKVTISRKTGVSRGGNRWTPRQVLDTLSNVTYLGLVRIGDTLHPGCHKPIVSPALFDQVAALIAERRNAVAPRSPESSIFFPLRGKLICGKCGRSLSPSVSHYGNVRYRYYRCRSHAGGKSPCTGASIPSEEIERTVSQMIADAAISEAVDDQPERQELAEAWATLSESVRRRQLTQVVDQTVLDFRNCCLKVRIVPGAADLIRQAESIS